MAEKIIPDLEFFAQQINNELRADLPTQRMKIAERLMNFPPKKMSELHLQDWYGVFWRLIDVFQYSNDPPQNKENAVQQILQFVQRDSDAVRRQYFALALLLFGKVQEFQSLADKRLWSKNLREDFENFSKFNQLTSLGSNLRTRTFIRRNQQIKNFLQEKYAYLIEKWAKFKVNDKTCPKVAQKDYQIYFCWLQGEDSLPPVVSVAYESLKMHAGKYKIIFIDERNYTDYVKLPEYIVKKIMGGGISRTHLSDIIRINLLYQYGGLWLDSTMLVTEPLEKHKNFWKLPYFSRKLRNEKNICAPEILYTACGRWATYVQGSAILNNPLFGFITELFYEHLKEYDTFLDYYLQDFSIELAYDNIPFCQQEIENLPINNEKVHLVRQLWNAPYEKFPYDKMIGDTFLHKLSWKGEFDMVSPNTVFREIQKRFAPNTIGKF